MLLIFSIHLPKGVLMETHFTLDLNVIHKKYTQTLKQLLRQDCAMCFECCAKFISCRKRSLRTVVADQLQHTNLYKTNSLERKRPLKIIMMRYSEMMPKFIDKIPEANLCEDLVISRSFKDY